MVLETGENSNPALKLLPLLPASPKSMVKTMEEVIDSVYMVSSILFILSLGGLSHQESSKRGNYYGMIAMAFSIGATLFLEEFHGNFIKFFPAFGLGGAIGLILALTVTMNAMPEMVAALHSFVGLAAVMVGFGKYFLDGKGSVLEIVEMDLGVFIGAITFTGSIVAWGKLHEVIGSAPLMLCGWGRHVINIVMMLGAGYCGFMYGWSTDERELYYLGGLTAIAFFVGWHLVMAIGGADMPVVISMLNSYSGWATSASGFLLNNNLLVITGALVGSSGAILSYIMCKAMNRAFFSVIMGGFGQGATVVVPTGPAGETKEINLDDLTKQLVQAKRIVIVPGYGMAVARCQRDVGTMVKNLRAMGKNVEFCIHPVAGRMPGHMNVLLAEADIPYDIVKEMEKINEDFAKTDVVMVIGANDIVNPDALENPQSIIAGMPVCEVWHSKLVVAFKRGRGVGYAGIENPLFFKANTRMYYGSADKSVGDILAKLGNQSASKASAEMHVEQKVEEEDDIPDSDIPTPTMTLGVPKEHKEGEQRVALTPSTIKKFRKLGFSVKVEKGAGKRAGFKNAQYREKGAQVVDEHEVWNADVVLKVNKVSEHELQKLSAVKFLISYFFPAFNREDMEFIANTYPELTVLAMDCVPRISKAQKLDSLSSQGGIAGYRAVIEALTTYRKCPKSMITAAGKVPPAKVFVIGAGVVGLAAIGYLKNLGCVVKAFDARLTVQEQVESLGGEFVQMKVKEDGAGQGGYAKEMSDEYKRAQLDFNREIASQVDIIISTALIPGRQAPLLLDEPCVKAMKRGSVIVDMAAEMGGNCSLTHKGEAFTDSESGVTILGYTDWVSRMAPLSSDMYGINLWHLLTEMKLTSEYKLDFKNEIVNDMAIVHAGKVQWRPAEQRQLPPASEKPAPVVAAVTKPAGHAAVVDSDEEGCWEKTGWIFNICLLLLLFVAIGTTTYPAFMKLFLSFVLSIIIGYMVIWNVTPALHTPLMSVTNAISGVIVIGAMLELESAHEGVLIDEGSGTGLVAAFFASINVVGGFVVTQRMLSMFKRETKKQ